MKKFVLHLFLLLTFCTLAQNKEASCANKKKAAQIDFKKGIGVLGYQQGQFENISFEQNRFIFFKKLYFLKKYKIYYSIYSSPGCLIAPEKEEEEEKCSTVYSDTFKKLILQKFGENFEEKANKQADELYQQFKKIDKKEQQKIVDTTLVYNFTESLPKFIGNDKDHFDFLRRLIIKTFTPKQRENIGLKIIYGRDGKIYKCFFGSYVENKLDLMNYDDDSIYDWIVMDENIFPTLAEQFEKKLNDFGSWVPAFIYHEKIKFTYGFAGLNSYLEL